MKKAVIGVFLGVIVFSEQIIFASVREYVSAATDLARGAYERVVGASDESERDDTGLMKIPDNWDEGFAREALVRHDYVTLKIYMDNCLRVLGSPDALAWANAQAELGEVLSLYLCVRNFAELVYKGIAIDASLYRIYLKQLLWFFYRLAYDCIKTYCLFSPLVVSQGKYPGMLLKMQGLFGTRVASFEHYLPWDTAKEQVMEMLRRFEARPFPSVLASISLYCRVGTGGVHCDVLDQQFIKSCCLMDRLVFPRMQGKIIAQVQALFEETNSWDAFFANLQIEDYDWLERVRDCLLGDE